MMTAAEVNRTFSHTDKINASHRHNSESDRSTPSGSSSCMSSLTKTSKAGETGLSSQESKQWLLMSFFILAIPVGVL